MKNSLTGLPCPWPAMVLATVTLSLVGCERPEPDIDLASVERVITTLSADDMLGRAAFTLGIDKAAEFIRDEFASIGLETFGELDDYLQRFMVYRRRVQSRRVVLNGLEIPSERFAVWAGAPSVRWATGDPVEVVVIGPEENAGERISSVRMSDRNTLVLMSSSHQAFFRRWADELSDPEFLFDPSSGPTLVCVLTDEAQPTSYEVEVMAPLEELPLTNVVGVIPGRRDDEIVLFGAHYDGIGRHDYPSVNIPVEGDSIANGANDGASNSTAVIELARYFKAKGEPERTLIFGAFTAEHIFHHGARYFARQLEPEKIVAMLSIAAMGKVDPRGPNTAHITGFDISDVGATLQHGVEGTPYSFYPDPYVRQYLFRRATNAPFACLGVPAHAIGTVSMDPRDEDLHRVSDEVETLDLNNMTSLIRGIALGAAAIISGEATPTRIDPPLDGPPCES